MTDFQDKLIVLEGIDAVGKTEVSKYIADELGYEYMKNPGKGIRKIRHYVESDEHSRQTKFLMYLASNSSNSDRAEKIISDGGGVVMDRYYPTTIVYNRVISEEKGRWSEILDNVELLEPDRTIYLHADEETRLERLYGRKIESIGKEKDRDIMKEVKKEYESSLKEFNMEKVKSVEGVEKVAEKILGKYK